MGTQNAQTVSEAGLPLVEGSVEAAARVVDRRIVARRFAELAHDALSLLLQLRQHLRRGVKDNAQTLTVEVSPPLELCVQAVVKALGDHVVDEAGLEGLEEHDFEGMAIEAAGCNEAWDDVLQHMLTLCCSVQPGFALVCQTTSFDKLFSNSGWKMQVRNQLL